jgi:conjugal transfer pilus assembly protein TraF
LLVLSTTSVAETQYAGTTPFVSGQSLKKGFFWYNDKEPVEKKKNNRTNNHYQVRLSGPK